MSKKIFIVTGGILVLAIVALLLPYGVELKNEIKIASSLFKVSDQLTDLRNWRHWHPAFLKPDTSTFIYSGSTNAVNSFVHLTDDHEFVITSASANGIVVQEKRHGKRFYQYITAFPDTLKAITRVRWVKAVTPFEWLREKLGRQKQQETGLNNLKKFLENPDVSYGFPIAIVHRLTDTLILTKKATVRHGEEPVRIRRLAADLRQYIKENKINGAPYLFEGFTELDNGKIEVSVGIPVTGKAPEKDGIKFLEMPSIGRVLRGHYEGAYSGLKELYAQMDRYVVDKSLKVVALRWEKYDQLPLTHNDSSHVKVELDYPIY